MSTIISDAKKRVRPTKSTEAGVLFKSRRRCALCYGLKGLYRVKKGQLAHIDKDRANSVAENLVFLCLEHHNDFDSRQSQAKGYTAAELKLYREQLYEFIEGTPLHLLSTSKSSAGTQKQKAPKFPMTSDLYDRRYAIYETSKSFIADIVRQANLETHQAIKFLKEVEQAEFLFDSSFSNYLEIIYKKAVRYAFLCQKLRKDRVDENFDKLIQEESEILLWFVEQFEILKLKSIPFMRWPGY
jgi:hypothetical protein